MGQASTSLRQICMTAIASIAILLGASACGSLDVYKNPSLAETGEDPKSKLGKGGYRVYALPRAKSSPELFMSLSFSGGGKRSSAFSYGVLKGLRDMQVPTSTGTHRLLDEVDGISSVSGGSFTSAYYALHRDKIFTDYEKDFLKRDIESYIWGIYLLPWHWGWMFDPFYGTSDAMQQIYDDLMFGGATYADLKRKGPPILWIGATDISYGRVFTFNQDTFDLLCSDLDRLPLARAVAASNGFPVLFSPITLENHAPDCDGWQPEWIDRQVAAGGNDDQRRNLLVQSAKEYLNKSRTKYIHLSDGGIVDNLALRGMINQLMQFAGDPEFARAQNLSKMRRLLIISVDGQAAQDASLAQKRVVTGLGQILNNVTGGQIDNYNFETLEIMQGIVEEYVASIKKLRCSVAPTIDGLPCDDVEGHLVHLSLKTIKDPKVRAQLEKIPTGLTLSVEDVDALVKAGESAVKGSPEVTKVIKALARDALSETNSSARIN